MNKLLTKRNYRASTNKKNLYIVIHYTANNGDTALNNCKYFEKDYRGASAHYFVDEKEVWQCVEDKDIAWHVGGASRYYNGARNENSIGIEMCSRKDSNGKYYIKPETIENTRVLTRVLMEKYNIPIENVVRHYDVTHKICPEPFVREPQQWEDFKKGLIKNDEPRVRI